MREERGEFEGERGVLKGEGTAANGNFVCVVARPNAVLQSDENTSTLGHLDV